MNVTRTELPTATAISTLTRVVERSEGQVFMSTPKAYELWDKQPLRMVKRWARKSVYWIIEGDNQ